MEKGMGPRKTIYENKWKVIYKISNGTCKLICFTCFIEKLDVVLQILQRNY